jgi:hypothetical protein
MLRTWIHRIKPGMEPRLRDWLAELNTRADELRESFAAGGVRAEQAFIVPGASGSLLVYVSEAADQTHAERVFTQSTQPIDVDHRRVMEECIAETLTDAPVYELAT